MPLSFTIIIVNRLIAPVVSCYLQSIPEAPADAQGGRRAVVVSGQECEEVAVPGTQ